MNTWSETIRCLPTPSANLSPKQRRSGRPRAGTTLLAGVLVAGVALLGGCSAASESDSSAASDSAAVAPEEAPGSASGGDAGAPALADRGVTGPDDAAAGSDPDSPAGSVTPVNATGEQLARRASMALQVKSIAAAAAKVRSIAAATDGLILSENIGGSAVSDTVDEDQVSATTYGEIAISVPSERLDATLDDLAALGTLIRRDASTDNVSQQLVDTDTRTKTMQASVDRIRALMTRTTDIEQIVRLESELSSRTADLESLKAQLVDLRTSVARSPIEVSLTTDPGVISQESDSGFLSGLSAGWGAFTSSVAVLLTVLGALLPFTLVAALVGIPLWVVLRRRRRELAADLRAGA